MFWWPRCGCSRRRAVVIIFNGLKWQSLNAAGGPPFTASRHRATQSWRPALSAPLGSRASVVRELRAHVRLRISHQDGDARRPRKCCTKPATVGVHQLQWPAPSRASSSRPCNYRLAPEAAREAEFLHQIGNERDAAAFGDVPEVERLLLIGRHQRFVFIGRRRGQRDEQPARRAHRWEISAFSSGSVVNASMLPWTACQRGQLCAANTHPTTCSRASVESVRCVIAAK